MPPRMARGVRPWNRSEQGGCTSGGACGQAVARGLVLRHEHGSQHMSRVLQDAVAFLGMESSPACVWAPQGHGYAERRIRTLKEHLLWITPFDTVEERRVALLEVRDASDEAWLLGRHDSQTPAQVRREQLAIWERHAA